MGRGTVAARGSPRIGAPRRSATAASSADAPARGTASPASTAGARAAPSNSAARSSDAASGGAGGAGGAGTCGGGAGATWTSSGRPSTTGPLGGSRAVRTASARSRGRSPARVTSHAPLASGRASSTSSPPRKGSPGSRSCTCWPTVTSTGTRARAAFRIPDIALARPGWTCTFTAARLPEAWA